MIDPNKFQPYQFLLTQHGKEAIKAEIVKFREKYGEKWKDEFCKTFPDFAEIINLIANFDAITAYHKLKELIEQRIEEETDSIFERIAAKATIFSMIDNNQILILRLHSELNEVIHKPRF